MVFIVAARFYTKKHEWVSVNDNIGTVGISNYAQVYSFTFFIKFMQNCN